MADAFATVIVVLQQTQAALYVSGTSVYAVPRRPAHALAVACLSWLVYDMCLTLALEARATSSATVRDH